MRFLPTVQLPGSTFFMQAAIWRAISADAVLLCALLVYIQNTRSHF